MLSSIFGYYLGFFKTCLDAGEPGKDGEDCSRPEAGAVGRQDGGTQHQPPPLLQRHSQEEQVQKGGAQQGEKHPGREEGGRNIKYPEFIVFTTWYLETILKNYTFWRFLQNHI